MNFKLSSPGAILGILGFMGTLATAVGWAPAGAFLSDPATANAVSYLVSGVLGLAAGAAHNGSTA